MPVWTPTNERVVYAFLTYAGRHQSRTVDAHMTSIRAFEAHLGRKAFNTLKAADVAAWRDALLRSGQNVSAPLSRSTICHRASHTRDFLNWLVRQQSCRRLDQNLAYYCQLPKAASAALPQPAPREYPSIEKARAMIAASPADTVRQRRDRAIVSALFLLALRADTAASIRLGDVDVAERRACIDARYVRTKNGKSMDISFFPVGDKFVEPLRDWVTELQAMGASPEEPLFPPDAALIGGHQIVRTGPGPIAPWASTDSIRSAFARACEAAGLNAYTPHAARHTIKALGDQLRLSEEALSAWSRNMGHETRQVTVSHYAKITDAQRRAIFDRLWQGDPETEDDKDLLLAYHEHRLTRGTADFEKAERLHAERMRRYRKSPKPDEPG